MAAGSAGDRLKLVTCAIVLLPFLVTIASSADIFLDWHVSTDINLKPVSTDQPVGIIAFDLFIFLSVFSHALFPNFIADMIGRS